MTANPQDLEALETALSELNQWRAANVDKVGTPQFTRTTIVHRQLTDLIAEGGGTPEQRMEVMRRLNDHG